MAIRHQYDHLFSASSRPLCPLFVFLQTEQGLEDVGDNWGDDHVGAASAGTRSMRCGASPQRPYRGRQPFSWRLIQ